ncbi:cytochrome P450 [Coniochaeta sp. 2T2.1]|nr:cytochrome P450 [Coniochaeta sp. 2T2.1]
MISNVPKPPWNPIYGHLKLMADAMALFPENLHPHVIFTYLHKKHNLPEVWYLDTYPLGPTFLICASPGSAAHAVQTRNYGKNRIINDLLTPMLGRDTLPGSNGTQWRYLQQLLAPLFRPSAARSLMGAAGQEMLILRDLLAEKSKTEEVFRMEDLVGNAIFEVTIRSLFGDRLGGQEKGGSYIMDAMRDPPEYMTVAAQSYSPVTKWRMRRKALARMRDSGDLIERRTLERYAQLKSDDGKVPECLVDAVLIDRIEAEQAGAINTPPLPQDREWMEVWRSQVRALLFGGHGTTTDTLCFTFMLLSLNPQVLSDLRAEHDRVVGPRAADGLSMLRDEPHRSAAELEYTTAVLKETLRMYPVGMTVRYDDKDEEGGGMRYNGRAYPTTKEMLIVPPSYLLGFDEEVYPEPGKFFPGRWLESSSPYPPVDKNAFRAFELGPRACPGREMAMDTMRALLLLTVRWFDFEVARDGEVTRPRDRPRVDWFDLDTKVGDLAWQELHMEAKPREGMRMIARRTDREL